MANTFEKRYSYAEEEFNATREGDCFIYDCKLLKEKYLCIKITDQKAFVLYNLSKDRADYFILEIGQADKVTPCNVKFTF